MAKKKKEELIRFYRGRNATVAWDAENNCELCRFDTGTYVTSDPREISILRSMNYQEVSLDATEPPPEPPAPIQPLEMQDVKPIPENLSMTAVARLQAEGALPGGEDQDGPAVEPPKPKKKKEVKESEPAAKPKNTPSTKPKKTVVKKRAIKRRTTSAKK